MMDAGGNEGALMPEAPDTSPESTAQALGSTAPDAPAEDEATAGGPADLKSSFRDALARKAGRNSHVESHLDGRHLGSGNNDTHKRQFRRKSG
jgi:uncharacterized protein DUF5302